MAQFVEKMATNACGLVARSLKWGESVRPLFVLSSLGLLLFSAQEATSRVGLAAPPAPDVAPQEGAGPNVPEVPPANGSESCEEVVNAARAAMSSGVRIEEQAANARYTRIFHAVNGTTCAARLAAAVRASSCSGNATGVVASALYASAATPEDDASGLVENALDAYLVGKPACARSVMPAVQQAYRVPPRLRHALSRASRAMDPALAESGWLLLGTAASIARARGDLELAESIDMEVSHALAFSLPAGSKNRAVLLEAAGNAGCRTCAKEVDRAMLDRDPWVRRAAASAGRFVPGAAGTMCTALNDQEPTVREHAAWALGFLAHEADPRARVRCLVRAASTDENQDVRKAAEQSLAGLMNPESGEVPQ